MFDKLSEEQRKKLGQIWKDGRKCLFKLEDNRWYQARIVEVKAEERNGKLLLQLFFDVRGFRLVKDFWLTNKGIFMFEKFLKKLGVEVRNLQDIEDLELLGKNCEILVSEKVFQDTTWIEIEDLRTKG